MNIVSENNTISLQEIEAQESYGLYNGKMGLCLIFYFKAQGDKINYDEKGKILLNEISENIAFIEGYSFGEGLLGIGWAVEWLVQNNLLNLNSDDFLEELDDEVYRMIMYSKANSIELNNGTLGRMLYLYKRVTSINPNRNFYKDICNKECLVLVIDELYAHLVGGDTALLKYSLDYHDLETVLSLSQSLIMLSKIVPLKYNCDLVNEMICILVSKIEMFFSIDKSKVFINNGSVFLLNAWREVGIKLNCPEWVKSSEEKYNEIKEEIIRSSLSEREVFILRDFDPSINFPLSSKSIFSYFVNNVNKNDWAEAWLLR